MSYNSKYSGNQVQNSLDWIAEAGGGHYSNACRGDITSNEAWVRCCYIVSNNVASVGMLTVYTGYNHATPSAMTLWFASGLDDNKQVKLIGKLEQWHAVAKFTKCRFVYDANDGSKPVYFDVKLNFTGIDTEHAAGSCFATLTGHTAITTSICTAQQSQLLNPTIASNYTVKEFDIA